MEAFKLQNHHEKQINSLKFEGLSLKYSDGFLFKDLNCELPLNEIVAFTGNRGCGKSSLVKIMAGIIQPTSGVYKINDQVISELTFDEFLPYRLNMGYSFDFGGLISNLTVYQNLILPLRYHNVSFVDHHEQVMKYLDLFGLMDVKDERPSSISGGMKKEACVARAFIMEPETMLFDDPTTGMSAQNKQSFLMAIHDRKRNGSLKNVFMATEDPLIVEQFVTKLLLISEGEIKPIGESS